MDGVPPLVAQAAAYDDDRRDDDGDEQKRANRRSDHSRIDAAPDHRRGLFRDRQAIHQGVAPDREDDVREHEIETGVPVPPVPDSEPVEAD